MFDLYNLSALLRCNIEKNQPLFCVIMQKFIWFYKNFNLLLICCLLFPSMYVFSQTKTPTERPKYQNNSLVRGKTGLILDDYLSRAENFGYQGIVLAAKNGVVILKKGYGYADRENGIPLTVNTRFQ
jgi:hypothetical protein